MLHISRTLRRLLPFLPSSARTFLIIFGIVSALLAIVDVVALMLLALALASTVAGTGASLPLIGSIPQDQILWLILVLAAVVVAKSAANVWLQWIATRRFASYELSVGQELFGAYIRSSWTDRISRNSAQIVQMSDTGIASVIAGFLLPVTTLPGLVVTSVGVFVVIVVSQPLTALVTIVYLGGIAMLQYFVLSGKTRQAARVARDSSLRVAALISGMVASLKEITLRDKAGEVSEIVGQTRARTAQARANSSFLSAVPRFIFDAAIIGGFIVVGGAAFLTNNGDMAATISAVALFGIAGFRLVPSLTGFQSVITRTITSAPYVDTVIADIEASKRFLAGREVLGKEPLPSEPKVLDLDGVGFVFPGSDVPAVQEVSVRIPLGSTVGIAGASGAGKSTLVDLLLGLLTPTAGAIRVDGRPLEDVLGAWRSHVGYVPQEVTLFDGTIAQNIALSWGADFDRVRVEDAARRAQLWSVIETRAEGLETRVGERGISLSGGQRQRLGIARALYNDPLVLVLDEATSALDTKTEADVADAIRDLRGDVTVIAVAHRLSTIRDSDQILFMQDGTVAAQGTFDQVVAENPAFAHQARLAGLA
ncbi:ABC transporter ATP-binding protein [Microbacterium aerolatum]|uniref:ABC transporter ATP-binding protein n=1 Tax=Microbacterium aerolatum TaxID=153731 RepID=A0A511A9T2_9MICO|nr:ABC transporter ATP-binding protein/permease [Microbacterium aerolatum]GEK84949.1 ABC transporter ATP-binding protein [Microbacterium aerolatum]GGB37483.1 ABC transporter ATP-binding protein [Microbacterium aerolatum]